MKTDTVIFDMDGLLLDTEPLWGECMLRVAIKNNINITPAQFKETTGLRIYEVTDQWAIYYPWTGNSATAVANDILDEIIAASKLHATVLPGVEQTLQLLRSHQYKIGLASSSPQRMIDALIQHFDIAHYFDVVTSADVVDLGKPHPAVFLHCAKSLKSHPSNCLVLEDSVNGMIAGKAARMKVVVVPDKHHYNDVRFSLADGKLSSMTEFGLDLLQ
jgi:HAD superfamily hydrolase (TIGR01509 family)